MGDFEREMDFPAHPEARLPIPFKPQEPRDRQSKATAVIDHAKRVHDWPTLVTAVDAMIEDQTKCVRWWDENVTPNKGGDRHRGEKRGSALFVSEAQELTGITQQQVSKWRRRLKDPEKYRAMLYGAAYAKAMAETNTIATKWTGDPENYTPSEYIEAARSVMGGIDLDPASNMLAQETVKAAEWYDESENGLLQDWQGRVFLNPPYAHPTVAHFIDKLCDHVQARDVGAAVLLTNNNTDTKCWHRAASLASAVCFTLGRINFYKVDGTRTQPTNGQTFFYFGGDVELFAKVFGDHGLIMEGRIGEHREGTA